MKSPKPPKPKPEDYYNQAKGYWDNYSKWTSEATDRFQRDFHNASARYASGGMATNGPGSEMVKKFQEARKTAYDEEMAGFKEGEHGKYIAEYAGAVRQDLRQALIGWGGRSKMGTGKYIKLEDVFGDDPDFKNRDPEDMTQTNALSDKIMKLTDEQIMEKLFGKYEAKGNKEKEALDRAKNAGGNNRGKGAGSKPQTASPLGHDKLGTAGWWG